MKRHNQETRDLAEGRDDRLEEERVVGERVKIATAHEHLARV